MSEQQNLALDQEGSLKSTLRSVYRSASDAMDGQSLFRSEKTLNRRIAGAPRQRCRSLSRDALIFPIEFLLIIRAEIRSVDLVPQRLSPYLSSRCSFVERLPDCSHPISRRC